MTAENLHDALNLLPADLIRATDQLRTAPKPKVIPWRRWVSLAAVLALVVGTTFVFRKTILPGMGGASDAAAQAPAAMAPEMKEYDMEAAAEEAAPQEAPAADTAADSTAENGPAAGASSSFKPGESQEPIAGETICIDHSHRFAEETEEEESTVGYCGNMMTNVYLNGIEHTFAGSDSVTITDILIHLDYDPDTVCRCAAEFTVDTEMLAGIEVNLTLGFARCDKGQAALTETQAAAIQEIIDSLE